MYQANVLCVITPLERCNISIYRVYVLVLKLCPDVHFLAEELFEKIRSFSVVTIE